MENAAKYSFGCIALLLSACGDAGAARATGGATSFAGASGIGAATSTGGMKGTGGLAGSGGRSTGGATSSGGASPGGSAAFGGSAASGGAGGGVASGAPGVWEHVSMPETLAGDQFQSLAHDPARPSDFYFAAGHNGDQRVIRWWKSTDFGASWAVVNDSSMHGDPWGFSIDPNPNRDPATSPTMWSPAGYGDYGAWKSTDGGKTWLRSAGADAAFGPYNPNGSLATDLYHLQILPDDPPNHVLATYHYGFKNSSSGGVGETWDGGNTWVVHPPAAGMGTSHYVIPVSATTWCVISQDQGIWRTTTAGRIGGTAAQKFRDGTISTNAWQKVDELSHAHGSHTSAFIGGVWYVPGVSSVKKTADGGATWQTVGTGFPITSIAGTTTFLYGSGYNAFLSRAARNNETVWDSTYTPIPSAYQGGPSPFGMSSGYDAAKDQWIVLMDGWDSGLWRYVEP